MAKESADTVAKLPPPNGWQGWPTHISAALKLGVKVARFKAIVQTGNLTAYQCPDRTVRYDPDQLERLCRDLQILSKRRTDGDDGDDDGLEELDETSGKTVATDVNKSLVDALKSANSMVLEMHKLLTSGSEKQASTYDKIVSRLLEREEAREKTICDVYAAREAYFNHQTERDLVAKREGNVEARRQEMWTITKGHLDKLVDVAFAKFGIPKEVMAKLEPAIALLQKLSPTQLQMLLGSGFLSKEQEDLVKKIVAEVPPEENVADKVAAECAAILEKQAAEKKAGQAAQAAAAEKAKPASVSTNDPSPPAPAPSSANDASTPAAGSSAAQEPSSTAPASANDASPPAPPAPTTE